MVQRVGVLCVSALFAVALAGQQPAVATLTGRACDEHGKPIAGAAVAVFTLRQFVDTAALLATPATRTAADGSYTVPVTVEAAYGDVVVAGKGRQACAMRIGDELARHGGAVDAALLVPGGSLSGRVRDADGAPLAGVQITITSSIEDLLPVVASLRGGAISNAEGIFTVPCVPRTGMRLTAQRAGYQTESRLVAQESPVDLRLRPVGFVRGTVVDADGAPVAGLVVHATTVERCDPDAEVRTAADGTFVLHAPAARRFRVNAHEDRAPHRRFGSALLHGPTDGVLVRAEPRAAPSRPFELVGVDAATKAPIDTFAVSQGPFGDPRLALAGHHRERVEYRGTARLSRIAGAGREQEDFVVVDAPGHGFAIAVVPETLQGPLVVELGPEAVLTGTVRDAETGLPLAGVAVRAVPEGGSGGFGGSAADAGPVSGPDGSYRIDRLLPGKYQVQAHASDRIASQPVFVTLAVGKPATLDLVAPPRQWLEFELVGALPEGPPCRLSLDLLSHSWSDLTSFQHAVSEPPLPVLTKAGSFRHGPVGVWHRHLELWVPSRTRIGTGTLLTIGDIAPGRHVTLELPNLARQIVTGQVVLPSEVPTERVAVIVRRWPDPGAAAATRASDRQANVAGLEGSGRFQCDLPTGSYRVQLADLETGIVFHTQPELLEVASDMPPLVLRPAIHWLIVELAPESPGGEVVLQSLAIELPGPNAFLRGWGSSGGVERGGVPLGIGVTRSRWLVPAQRITVRAMQTFELLWPWSQGYSGKPVATESVDICDPEHRIELRVAPPPSDEQLERREK